MRGERMPVSHEEKAFVLVLELDPVLQYAVIVAEMQAARGAHAGENSISEHNEPSSSNVLD